MKLISLMIITINILVLSACGGGSDDKSSDIIKVPDETPKYTLQNIRFDAKDYYEGERVTVTEGTSFEVQWVSPTSASYRIDLYLSVNGETHSVNNKIVGLKCGSATFSLCPNATGQVQCEVEENKLSCSLGSDSVGSEYFQKKYLSSLKFIIKGCDAFSNCDVKSFGLSVQNNTGN